MLRLDFYLLFGSIPKISNDAFVFSLLSDPPINVLSFFEKLVIFTLIVISYSLPTFHVFISGSSVALKLMLGSHSIGSQHSIGFNSRFFFNSSFLILTISYMCFVLCGLLTCGDRGRRWCPCWLPLWRSWGRSCPSGLLLPRPLDIGLEFSHSGDARIGVLSVGRGELSPIVLLVHHKHLRE